MRLHQTFTRGLAAAALSIFGLGTACDGGSNNKEPTDSDYDDVATTMGALVADREHGEVTSMSEATLIAEDSVALSFVLSGDTWAGIRFGLAISYTVTCRDDANVIVTCGELTSSADVKASAKGDWSSAHLDASADFKGDWHIEDVGEAIVTIDGSASAKVDSTVRSETSTRRWKLDYTAQYDGVGIDSDSRMAVSGEARYAVKLERKVDSAEVDTQDKLSVKAVVTFAADGSSSLLIDGKHKYKVKTDGSVTLVSHTAVGG